jgi:Protein of unknown function (DUF2971)
MSSDTQEQGASVERRPNVDIEALNAFLEHINSAVPDLIYGPQDDQPLFHYTDLGGLQGIVENDDLWLTHSKYSNDNEEMSHGYGVAEEFIEEESRNKANEPARIEYLNEISELLVQKPMPEGIYICCFCKRDDLLSQWRSYGANGTGVSIQFDPQGFAHVIRPDSRDRGLIWLWKVSYKRKKQRDILQKAMDFGFGYKKEQPLWERARRAADAIQFFIPTFKNEDFEEEREYRLIFAPSPRYKGLPQFRIARGMLVPYYSLKELTSAPPMSEGCRLPITGVRIGPSVQKDLNVESTQLLLRRAKYPDNVNVVSSDTPYRG